MKTIAITSGKGGVGKTSVAVNLGLVLARLGKRVLVFDADLGLANVDILLGLSCDYTLVDALDGSRSVQDVMVETGGMTVLPASSGILSLERMTPTQRLRIAAELQKLSASFDLLLVDTGAGLSENVLFFASTADEVLLVTTPEPTALTDAYAMVKVLANTYESGPISLLVNQVASPLQGHQVHEKLGGVAERFLQRQVQYFGHLPYDAALEHAVAQRRPVVTHAPQTRIAAAFVNLARGFDESFSAAPRNAALGIWDAIVSESRPGSS